MSRSSGIYPSYVKLDFDSGNPPDGWNDGVRRCVTCKKAWPNLGIFSPSPCCNTNAGISKGEDLYPEMTWEAALRALYTFRFERYYDKWNEGLTDEELAWLDGDDSYENVRVDNDVNEFERLVRLDSR